jgi:hypothetical protein
VSSPDTPPAVPPPSAEDMAYDLARSYLTSDCRYGGGGGYALAIRRAIAAEAKVARLRCLDAAWKVLRRWLLLPEESPNGGLDLQPRVDALLDAEAEVARLRSLYVDTGAPPRPQ